LVLWKDKQVDKLSAELTKGEKSQTNKYRHDKGDITRNNNEIQWIIRECFKKFHSNKLENLEEIDKFLDACDLPNWTKPTTLMNRDAKILNKTLANWIEQHAKKIMHTEKMKNGMLVLNKVRASIISIVAKKAFD
jgi:hypothetical protein